MLRRAGRVARSLVGRAVALGGAAIVAYSPPGIAVCVANPALEKEELEKLLELSSIPKVAIHDLERVKLASITRYCSYAGGKLAAEPPDTTTIANLLALLRKDSLLAGSDAWPNPGGSDDEKQKYLALATSFVALGRYASQMKETALRRELEGVGMAVAGPLTASAKTTREEDEKKNHRQTAVDLTKLASALYSIDFGDPCDSSVLVETYHAFGRNRLAVGHLKGGKYGRPSVHLVDKTHYVSGDDGVLKEETPVGTSAPLTRNASVLEQIFNVTESLVIAGVKPINSALAHHAEQHGVVRRGESDQKQVNFDMTTKLKVDKAFTRLSGTLGPKELEVLFEDNFVPTLGGLMAEGHSCASGCQNILLTAAWMRPRAPDATVRAPSVEAAGTASTSASTPTTAAPTMRPDKNGVVKGADGQVLFYTADRVAKMQAGHTKTVEEMKASKARALAGNGGGRVRWDDRRRDEPPYYNDARREHHQQR